MWAHPSFSGSTGTRTSLHDEVLHRVAAELEVAAATREHQLQLLPPARSAVAQAHQDSVRRILTAIRTAQAQLRRGTYGDCCRCGRRTDLADVPRRPWAPLCETCDPY